MANAVTLPVKPLLTALQVSPLSLERKTPPYSVPAKILPLLLRTREFIVPPKGPLLCSQKSLSEYPGLQNSVNSATVKLKTRMIPAIADLLFQVDNLFWKKAGYGPTFLIVFLKTQNIAKKNAFEHECLKYRHTLRIETNPRTEGVGSIIAEA